MSGDISLTFFGTSSGGGPSESRNCSSLVVDALHDNSLWMVDCAEGTLRQFSLQPHGDLRWREVTKVKKVFITHMHADHIMGIVPLLRRLLFPPLISLDTGEAPPPAIKPPSVELYGPSGLRAFIRFIMRATHTGTADTYTVHELVTASDTLTPCIIEDMHSSEAPGRDILCDPDGFWRGIVQARGKRGEVLVDAGLIEHRAPCIGYLIREPSPPQRSLLILGDTSSASAITPLLSRPPSLLVHEATDAYIPPSVDPNSRRSPEVVLAKAKARGHATPTDAGAFAALVSAERLVLNHVGGRFPAPRPFSSPENTRTAVLREIERQASAAWGAGKRAVAAVDFMTVIIPPEPGVTPASAVVPRESAATPSSPHEEEGEAADEGTGGSDSAEKQGIVYPHGTEPWREGPGRGRGRGHGGPGARGDPARGGRGRGGWYTRGRGGGFDGRGRGGPLDGRGRSGRGGRGGRGVPQ